MKRDHKGFTIVELIIAVAILAIVTLAVCGFILVGSKSYTNANTDIMLQQDAQLALNQISDVIIDTTHSISYDVDGESVLKDAEYGGEATQKTLIVANSGNDGSQNHNENYWFRWCLDDPTNPEAETGKIYFHNVPAVDVTGKSREEATAAIETAIKNDMETYFPESGGVSEENTPPVLAEHVKEISIDISQFEENRVVMIAMTFKNGDREYHTSNNVTVRNRIAINAIEVDPMKIADAFVIESPDNVVMEPGETLTLTANVSSTAEDQAVTWEMAGGALGSSSISADGTVTVGRDEVSERFQVRVKRVNEQYTGQNDRVSKLVTVKVKRVTFVADATIEAEPGEEVPLTPGIHGGNLGTASPCSCGYDGSDDYLVDSGSWRITENSELATLGTTAGDKATVKVSASAKDGDVIVVEADSLRSKDMNYGPAESPMTAPVTGRWTITVKGNSNVVPLPADGGFKFGTDNDDSAKMTYNFIADNAGVSNYHRYVVCARVRERGAVNSSNDQVLLYYTNVGRDARFIPDLFGLDLTRSYEVYLQLLLPVDRTQNKYPQGDATSAPQDSSSNIAAEYFAPGNLDPNGAYIGEKYEVSPLFAGILSPPNFSVECEEGTGAKITYPNDAGYQMTYHLASGGSTVINKIEFGSVLNIRPESLGSNNVKFSIYKEEAGGSDLNGWKLIAGYDANKALAGEVSGKDVYNFVTDSFGDEVFKISTGDSSRSPIVGTNYMTRGNKEASKWAGAVGTYHIVPGFWYRNLVNGEQRGGGYDIIEERNLHGDHNWHFYQLGESQIPLKVDIGLNLELIGQDGSMGKIAFSLPTETGFPFALKNSEKQTQEIWSAIYKNGSVEYMSLLIECEYNDADGSYKLHIYRIEDVYWPERKKEKVDSGIYKWKPGNSEWTCHTRGTGNREKIDIPLP